MCDCPALEPDEQAALEPAIRAIGLDWRTVYPALARTVDRHVRADGTWCRATTLFMLDLWEADDARAARSATVTYLKDRRR